MVAPGRSQGPETRSRGNNPRNRQPRSHRTKNPTLGKVHRRGGLPAEDEPTGVPVAGNAVGASSGVTLLRCALLIDRLAESARGHIIRSYVWKCSVRGDLVSGGVLFVEGMGTLPPRIFVPYVGGKRRGSRACLLPLRRALRSVGREAAWLWTPLIAPLPAVSPDPRLWSWYPAQQQRHRRP